MDKKDTLIIVLVVLLIISSGAAVYFSQRLPKMLASGEAEKEICDILPVYSGTESGANPYIAQDICRLVLAVEKQDVEICKKAKTKEFIARLYKNIPVLGSGARGSTITFVERGIGDVLIAWENEAFLAIHERGKDKFEIVIPSISILAEPPVTVVDKVVKKHGTEEVAKAYLEFLYTEAGQEIVAKHYYRGRSETVMKKYADRFPQINLVTIEHFGGWQKAQADHFADGGIFDKIYQ